MLEMVLLINEYVSAADVIDLFKNMKLLVIEVFLFVNECYLSNVFFCGVNTIALFVRNF